MKTTRQTYGRLARIWRMWWGLVLSALTLSALADGRNYEPRVAPIYAGVIAFGPNDTAVRDVYTFYILDQRTDLKPPGLSFQNPRAPAGAGRDQAAYWLVDLSKASDTLLARYRILLLSRSNLNGMTIEMREKLRRFVDGGGVLWVDLPASGSSGELFFPKLSFGAGTGALNYINLNHPLLRGYYTLSPLDVARLGARGRGFGGGTVNVGEPALQLVAGVSTSQGVIWAGNYGSGRILVSAAGIAAAMNAPFTRSDGTPPPRARTIRLEAVPALELKFAYNLVRWIGGGMSDAFNLRRANAVPERYGAPLGVAWKDEGANLSRKDGAVLYGGLLLITTGGKLICYDTNPLRDLDGDGRADDGVRDLEEGKTYDKVWEAQLGGSPSPPVIVETKSGVQVVVSTGTEVAGYWLLPRDPNTGIILPQGQLVWRAYAPVVSASTPALPNHPVAAPIAIENMLIVPATLTVSSRPTAGFYALDLGDGTNPKNILSDLQVTNREWFQPRTSTVGEWLLPPVAGYVPNRAQGGGSDLMIYFGTQRDISGQGTQLMDGVQAFWLGAKGEQLIIQRNPDGIPNGYLHCRITGQARIYVPSDPNSPLRPRVYEMNPQTGAIEEINPDRLTFNQGTQGRVSISGVNPNRVYYIDYYIDWASLNNPAVMMRSFLNLPAMASNAAQPPNRLRGFTLGSNGVLYIATGTDEDAPNVANGNLIAVMEQWSSSGTRSGGSILLWRWQSHGGYQQPVPGQAQPLYVPPATIWAEPNSVLTDFLSRILNFAGSSSGDPRGMNFRFVEAPIYANGVVYALGQGRVRIGFLSLPYTILLAFDADPEQFVIDLRAPIDANATITLSQRDYARSGPLPVTNVQVSMTYSAQNPDPLMRVDYGTGQIRLSGFRQSQTGGSLDLLSAISISQPVAVSVGTLNTLIDPDADPLNPNRKLYAGNWDNLLWYAVLLGQEPQGGLVNAGDILYLPVKVTPPGSSGRRPSGVIGLAADPYRYQPDIAKRHAQAGTIPFPNLDYGSVIRWPFIDDLVNDVDISRNPFAFLREFFTRFVQGLPYEGDLSPLVIGDGQLLLGTGGGLHLYTRQRTIIADEGRLVEVDAAGQVIWGTENTQLEFSVGSFVPSFAKYALTPNARVYRYGENQFLVVESERNRIVILDRAGEEVRTITGFLPDLIPQRDDQGRVTGVINLRDPNQEQEQGLLGSNYVSGMPTMLRNPTDVTVWTEFVPKARNPFAITSNTGWEYWIHYTIADTGNNRVVDIVDRFVVDPNTFAIGGPVSHPQLNLPMTGVLYWMTPTVKEGQGYHYVGVQRFEYWDGRQTRVGFVTLVQNAAARGNDPASDPSTPEAGMIILQIAVNVGGRAVDQTLYIRKMRLPDGTDLPILSPVSIDTSKRSLRGGTGLFLLVTTSTGIYELQVPLTGTIGDTLPVTWMFTNEAYSLGVRRRLGGIRLQTVDGNPNSPPLQPILFKPRQARYLLNGNLLIVNGYMGSTVGISNNQEVLIDFPGEVFELRASDFNPNDTDPSDGSLLGFSNGSILWSTADRPAMSGSAPLRKPSSADRVF